MIRSFGDRDTETLFQRDVSRRWQATLELRFAVCVCCIGQRRSTT
jgi:hypothetical protein